MEIEIKDIRKRYGKREILKGVSFSASGGECIGILGGNGCGKSTLLSILAGVLRADGGNFFFRQPAEAPSVPPDGASGGNSTNIGNGRNTENGANAGNGRNTGNGANAGNGRNTENGANAGNGRNTENGANAGNGRNTGNGINIDLLRTPKRRAALVGYVPQGTPLIEELSALDNLLMWYDRQTLQSELPECFPRRRAAGAGAAAAAPRDSFLSRLGIGEFLRVPVRKLSGGMKKRLAIACAMANRPPILLLDEPTAALDIPCKEEIHEYLSFYKSLGGILLFVTHDLLDLTMCDRLLLLRDGAISPFAKPDDPAALAKAIGGAFSPAGEGRTADTPAAAGGGKA